GVRAMVEGAWTAFPDYHEEVHELIAEGDRVVIHLTISGTQQGQWGPLPATGKRVAFDEIVILQIRDGKVLKQRGIVDNLSALRQLGAVPTPRPSSTPAHHARRRTGSSDRLDVAHSACALCLMGIDQLTRQEILKRYTNPLAWLADLNFSASVVPQSYW